LLDMHGDGRQNCTGWGGVPILMWEAWFLHSEELGVSELEDKHSPVIYSIPLSASHDTLRKILF